MQLTAIESVTFRSNSTILIRGCRVLVAMLLLAPLSSAMAGTLYIGGSPPVTIGTPSHYYFRPWIAGSDKASAKFAIRNKPYWASFDPSTGTLSGKVYAGQVGNYASITISASSATSSTRMPSFSIAVTSSGGTSPPPVTQTGNGSATLSWLPPTSNTNGTVLTNLAGYQIKYGTNSGALSQTIQVANPGLTTYVISNLSPGTYYFATLAYTSTGAQSTLSTVVTKTIQ
jgi:fibronectin type III domain protein/putative Ig domain-containing protein